MLADGGKHQAKCVVRWRVCFVGCGSRTEVKMWKWVLVGGHGGGGERMGSDLPAGTHIVVVVPLLLLRLLVAFWPAVVAGGLDTHDIAVPGWRADRRQL